MTTLKETPAPLSIIPGTSLRVARPDDIPSIQTIVTAAYTKYIERIGKPPAPMLADYTSLLESHTIFVLDTLPAATLVGSIVLDGDSQDETAVQVTNLVVDPSSQGRGYGKALMRCAEDFARERGRPALVLYTNVKMYENFGLYERMGFREVRRAVEDGYERVYFRKEL